MYEISSCRLVIKSLYLSIRRAQPALETSQTDLLGDREFPSWRALLPNNTNYQLIFIPQPPHYRAGQTRGVFTFLFVYQKDDPLSSACRGGECCIVSSPPTWNILGRSQGSLPWDVCGEGEVLMRCCDVWQSY